MTQVTIDALGDLQDHIRALLVSEHITGEEKDALEALRDRLDTRIGAIRRGEALRPERAVPDAGLPARRTEEMT
jgi:hypothetical protein